MPVHTRGRGVASQFRLGEVPCVAKGAGSQGQSGGEGEGAGSQSGREGEEDSKGYFRVNERFRSLPDDLRPRGRCHCCQVDEKLADRPVLRKKSIRR